MKGHRVGLARHVGSGLALKREQPLHGFHRQALQLLGIGQDASSGVGLVVARSVVIALLQLVEHGVGITHSIPGDE